MSLRQQLTEMMAVRPAAYRALLDALADRLNRTAVQGALRAGDPVPPFVLPDVQGDLVFSDDLLRAGPLVIVFFRGDWCPFCRTTLTALNAIAADIAAAGAAMVAITPDTGEYLRKTWHDLQLGFPVLSDADSATGLQFGAVYHVPDDLVAYWAQVGIDLEDRHGDAAHVLPMPGTFIANSAGILRFAHTSGDITDRVEPQTILAALRAIAAGAPPAQGG